MSIADHAGNAGGGATAPRSATADATACVFAPSARADLVQNGNGNGHANDDVNGNRNGDSERTPVRVAIVCNVCSLRHGGEAAIGFHYFRVLRRMGVDAYLVAHARNRRELHHAFAGDVDRIHFVEDHRVHRILGKLGRFLPDEVTRATTDCLSILYTHLLQRRIIRRLVREYGVNVVHQPTPVSPAQPSLIDHVDAPVVIGPMNGGIKYPRAFRRWAHPANRFVVRLGRLLGRTANKWCAGKLHAKTLLAANARTAELVLRFTGRIAPHLVENGVDVDLWRPPIEPREHVDGQPLRFVFSGRLITWKGVELLLRAWATLPPTLPVELRIIGDGPARARFERLRRRLDLEESVTFAGWLSQPDCARELAAADVLVHPSLRECGGASVLEAMACGLPVIACAWGGPMDYVDERCAMVIPPTGTQQFINDLAAAIVRLAESAPLRQQLGAASRERAVREFSWDAKVDQVLALYQSIVSEAVSAAPTTEGGAGTSAVTAISSASRNGNGNGHLDEAGAGAEAGAGVIATAAAARAVATGAGR